MNRSIYIGISMCASWAWGVSLLVTLSVLEQRGVVPFWIWATMNTLAIPLFGWVIMKLPHLFKQIDHPALKTFMIVIQLFSIMINIQAVYEAAQMAGFSHTVATWIGVLTGIVFVASTYKNGLKVSMFTDQFQWMIALAGLIILIGLGMETGEFKPLPMGTTAPDLNWAFYSWILLFCGPFVDLQGWQRAKLAIQEKQTAAFKWSGVFFFAYMLLVYLFAHFARTDEMGWIIFVVAFMVATSTLDSNAAALQEIGHKKGFILGMAACIFWPLLKEYGILALWTTVASFRMIAVVIMLAIAIHVRITGRGQNGEETIYR